MNQDLHNQLNYKKKLTYMLDKCKKEKHSSGLVALKIFLDSILKQKQKKKLKNWLQIYLLKLKLILKIIDVIET